MPQYNKVFDAQTYTGIGTTNKEFGMPDKRIVGPSGFQVSRSLRFRQEASTWLNRTITGTPNATTATISFWFKKIKNKDQTAYTGIWTNGAGTQTYALVFNVTASVDGFGFTTGGGYYHAGLNDIRDSQWNHYVWVVDMTNATADSRMRFYCNNVLLPSNPGLYARPAQNSSWTLGAGNSVQLGRISGSGYYLDGYMSEWYYIDGTAAEPSAFGEYNSDGIWVPKAFTGTYGASGFKLDFATTNPGTDASGNGLNWTPSGWNTTVANTTYDITTDSPTDYGTDTGVGAEVRGNYPILNPSDAASTTLVQGAGRRVASAAANYNSRANMTIPSYGKWYFEATVTTTTSASVGAFFGLQTSSVALTASTTVAGSYHLYGGSPVNICLNGATAVSIGGVATAGDVLQIAIDVDNSKMWFGKNNVWYNSAGGTTGNPATGANPVTTDSMVGLYPVLGMLNNTLDINFGQRVFSYTAPSGFKCLCSTNLIPPPTNSMWFYGDTPDLVWIKNRTTTGTHTLIDTVRGVGIPVVTSSTTSEGIISPGYPAVSRISKYGMTLINDSTQIVNGSTNSHIYYAWKAGGSSVINTTGTISANVSANPSTGFSIVTYGGTGANGTVGHGLGAAPNFIIVKRRDTTANFAVYHSSLTSGANYMLLNTTAAQASGATYWNSTAPTSSVFSVGTSADTNTVTTNTLRNYVAYCWASIPGYSAFGRYTGNGSADGPFVYTGFRPRFILAKLYDQASGNWVILDTTRDTYNPIDKGLYLNVTNSEATTLYVDATANGFKIRHSSTNMNTSGYNYIYAAFAEIPFNFSRAR